MRSTSVLGPRESNQARFSGDSLPVPAPSANAELMWGSRLPVCPPAYSAADQPPLFVSSL